MHIEYALDIPVMLRNTTPSDDYGISKGVNITGISIHAPKLNVSTILKRLKDFSDAYRQIKPLLAQIKTWIGAEQFKILPKSPIGKAMAYFINQYPKLEAIFDDGRIELDNNLIENAIRPMAIGYAK